MKKLPLFLSIVLLVCACSNNDDSATNIALSFNDQTFLVDENQFQDAVIATLQTEANPNDVVTFTLVSQTPFDAINLNSDSGEITVANADLFDYEILQTITAQITATNGDDTITAEITISINNLEIPNNDLMAKYLFNGNANDTSSNQNHGVISGSVNVISDRNNIGNAAYEFNPAGSSGDGKITLPSFGTNEANFTISCWVYDDFNSQTHKDFLYKGDLNNANYRFRINGSNDREFIAFYSNATNTGYNFINSQQSIFNNQWKHVVLKVENNLTWSVYVDGVLANTNTFSNATNWTAAEILVGLDYRGKIDDLYFYNRALSDTEIYTLFKEDNN